MAQSAQGIDVIFQNAGAAGLGVIQAFSQNGGVGLLGSNSNQNSVAADAMLRSVLIDFPHAFLTVVREVKVRHFCVRIISLGMRNDVVRLIMNSNVRGRIPLSVLVHVDSVRALMQNGALSALDTAGGH